MNRKSRQTCAILDCTIRDGGYVNNWDFDKKFVKELYRNISRSGVDILEIGFRNKKSGTEKGLWYSVPERIIDQICKGVSGIPLALMVDYGRFAHSDIPPASSSMVKMYRLASHKENILSAIKACERIKKKGYAVSLQFMGITNYAREDFKSLVAPLKDSAIDYLYFADSYGSLFPQDVERYVDMFRVFNKKIGFHAHDSLQLAFANTLEAVNNGVAIVDATVYGIGRGTGNLPLETLIVFFERTLQHSRYNSIPILDLIDRYFVSLKNEFKWGYSLPGMLSGIFKIHPNYAKSLIEYREFNVDEMVKFFEFVKSCNPTGFDKSIIERIFRSGFISQSVDALPHNGVKSLNAGDIARKYTVPYRDRHKNKDFLILANGPTLKEYRHEIDKFITKFSPVTIGANYLGGLFIPDYHIFSNKKRFIQYIDSVHKKSALLLSTSFDKNFISQYTDRDFEWLVHLENPSTDFGISQGVITTNCRTVAVLAIATAIVMGGRRIFVVGLDGYKNKENFLSHSIHFYNEMDEPDDYKILLEKHNANETLLNNISRYLLSKKNSDGLYILTPTSHKHFYSSIENWIK